MLRLPPILSGSLLWRLPLSESSAAALAEALLRPDLAEQSTDLLTKTLDNDPALSLWTVCRAYAFDGLAVRTSVQAAQWLASRLLTLLDFHAKPNAGKDADTNPIEMVVSRTTLRRWAVLVSNSVAVATGADFLARSQPQQTACSPEKAYWLGLLHNASQWFASVEQTTETPSSSDLPDCLPPWLVTSLAEIDTMDTASLPEAAMVAQAYRQLTELTGNTPILLGKSKKGKSKSSEATELAAAISFDKKTIRAKGDRAKKRFTMSVGGVGRQLFELTRRLTRLAILENDFAGQLETEKLTAMKQFSYGAGHDINNPIQVISGHIQVLLHDETNPERRRKLANINHQALRVFDMIADTMHFARPPKLRCKPIQVETIVDQVMQELSELAKNQGTQLLKSADEGPFQIEADPTQLAMALHAIGINSLEAIGAGEQIEFSIRWSKATTLQPIPESDPATIGQQGSRESAKKKPSRGQDALDTTTLCQRENDEVVKKERSYGQDACVEITIHDTGPGISSKVRDHLFDPFYSGREAGRGLGFGLSKAWRIVTDHGGHITVKSPPKQGTTFTITLPASRQ